MNGEPPMSKEEILERLSRLLPPNAPYPTPAEICARRAIARHRFAKLNNYENNNGEEYENCKL